MITAAVVAAVIAAIALAVAVRQLRDSARTGVEPTSVLVAGGVIAKGTSATVAADRGALLPTSIAKDEVQTGALVDAAVLKGRIAARDILPGQQITAVDFTTARNGLAAKLAANERAVSVPLDKAHGLVGDVKAGDKVDVLVGFLVDGAAGRQRPVLRVLMQNVLVLRAPDAEDAEGGTARSATQQEEVVLRIGDRDADRLAFAADNGKVWLALRPPTGSIVREREIVTLESLLAGARAVRGRRGS